MGAPASARVPSPCVLARSGHLQFNASDRSVTLTDRSDTMPHRHFDSNPQPSMDMTELPQLAILPGLVRHLLRLDFVDEVYLSGSLGRGQGDRYSDVDLQVAVTRNFSDFLSPTILAELLGAPPLALKQINLGPHLWLHNMILADGTMLDLVCRTDIEFADTEQWTRLDGREWPPIDLEVPKPSTAWAPQAATADEIAEAVELFWVTIHKHRRGLIRKQDLAIWTGIRYSICDLLRLQFIAATDRDPGGLMHMGIYELSGTSNWLENHADWDWRTVLAWSQDPNWPRTVSRLTDAGSKVCRELTATWALPARLTELADRVSADWDQAVADDYHQPEG